MNSGGWVALTIAAPFIIYFAARLIFAAYFLSKQDHERKKKQ